MQSLMPLLITVAIIFFIILILNLNKELVDFYTKGFDSNFKAGEISVLWRLSRKCKLDNPVSLYYSVPTLNKCISMMITQSRHNGSEKSAKMQNFLAKLYRFRTRVILDMENKKGINNTKSLSDGQKLQLVLPGKGVFFSKIVNNSRELVISMPKTKSRMMLASSEWEGKKVSVYLWRKNDANYVFDTVVAKGGTYLGLPALFLLHTNSITRTQKRQSVRCDCNIYAQMYVIRDTIVDYDRKEQTPGYKCLLENISEDGALIRIGGQGVEDVQIKLQFKIDEDFIMMYGIVRAVEYNPDINQSRLHFECIHLEKNMKNAILTYVYNVLPSKDENDVVDVSFEDELPDDSSSEEGGEDNTEEQDAENPDMELEDISTVESLAGKLSINEISDNFENQIQSLTDEVSAENETKLA